MCYLILLFLILLFLFLEILLHPQEEPPVMSEQGFAAAPGTHTLVSMKRNEVHSMEPPYGTCHPDNLPVCQCNAQCWMNGIIRRCGCHAVYMSPNMQNNTRMCDFKQSLSCARETLDLMKRSKELCICNPPCLQVNYGSQLSYAQLSKFNIERMILDNPQKQHHLQKTYLKALETTQRYQEEIRVKDEIAMTRLLSLADTLNAFLSNNTLGGTDPQTAPQHFNLPAIFFQDFLDTDYDIIAGNIRKAHEKARSMYFDSHMMSYHINNNIKDRFLEWDGSVSALNQMLDSCLESATSENDEITDRPGDNGTFPVDNTTINYGSRICRDYIHDKVQYLSQYYSMLQRYVNQEKMKESYISMINKVFENSTKTPDGIEKHDTCLQVLMSGEEATQESLSLLNYTEDFRNADSLEAYKSATQKLVNIITSGLIEGEIANLSSCEWVRDTLYGIEYYRWKDKASQSITSVFSSFESMSRTIVSMAMNFELLIRPLFGKVSGYLNGNIMKADLAIHMHSPLASKIVGDMAAFETDAYTVIKALQERLSLLKHNLIPLYMEVLDSRLPIFPVDQIKNLEFIKASAATNRTEFQQLIQGLEEGKIENLQLLMEKVFMEYNREFQDLLKAILVPFRQISLHLSELQSDLSKFAEISSLNVNFFMENFLQVDIFYKEMSYGVIAQQEAFGLLSLLGEIGGFMGLLLGASIITVCELLDYIVLNVIRGCSRRRKVDPITTVKSYNP